MRALHSGSASAFQADSAGSIPAARSKTSFRRVWRNKIPQKNLKKRCWQARKYLVKYKTYCEKNTEQIK